MDHTAKVLSVNISEKKGTIKLPVGSIDLDEYGVKGDAHAGDWGRQVSLLGMESVNKFSVEAKRKIAFGEFAENITTEGIVLYHTHPLDRFTTGDVELEVTQIGKKCHGDNCAIFREVGNCVMPKEGIFCRVVKPGTIKEGDLLEYHPRTFHVGIITLSDRAYEGQYEDRSGPRIQELMDSYFTENSWQSKFSSYLLPDEPTLLEKLIEKCLDEKTDIIFTTGGTGIGPRDVTPDVVRPFIEKEIPGIMEMIRLKYGQEKPNALVSRSISGVTGRTLIYTLPGSVKAVNEYMAEITRSLKHTIYMLHGLDTH